VSPVTGIVMVVSAGTQAGLESRKMSCFGIAATHLLPEQTMLGGLSSVRILKLPTSDKEKSSPTYC
jgi:hypothetical protein